jgi:short-subunit dehydrogenase
MKLSGKEQARLKEKYGPWAVITGASSGIGKELAKQLAGAGLNLVLCARSEEKLDAMENAFRAQYGIDIKVVVVDVAEPDALPAIVEETKGLKVGLIVASAGYGTSGLFTSTKLSDEINMLRVNGEALLSITHHFSRRFAAQKRGGIILMSSLVAFQGVPYSANYAATKAYVQSLAEALAMELKPYGVDVLAAAPGPVSSGFAARANIRMSMSLMPAQIGAPILKALGRKTTVLPGFLSKLLVYSLRTLPRWGKVKVIANVMGGMTKHQRE